MSARVLTAAVAEAVVLYLSVWLNDFLKDSFQLSD
jgi:hypothetical protein